MGKHSIEKKHSKSGKMFIITAILLICICVCGYMFFIKKETHVNNAINSFFSAIKENNIEIANKYTNYKQLLNCIDGILLEENNPKIENIKKELFKDIKWDIKKIEVIEDKAKVIIEVTNKDFKNIITRWMKELIVLKSSNINITNEVAIEKLDIMINEEKLTKTIIKEINLYKDGNGWKIVLDENLRDLIYPGIDAVISTLDKNIK